MRGSPRTLVLGTILLCAAPVAAYRGPPSARRRAVCGAALGTLLPARAVTARAPGSQDPAESVKLMREASVVLKQLQIDWPQYTVIDSEGRAGDIDAARRILGGVTRQNSLGLKANLAAAFACLAKAAVVAPAGGWGDALDAEAFIEAGERVTQALGEADDGFYSSKFASKGTSQVEGIFRTARGKLDASVRDVDGMLGLLTAASAPGT